MRAYLIVFACLFSCASESTCKRQFFDAVTRDPRTFIAFDADIDGRKVKVCFTNQSLRWRLEEKFGIEGRAYTELVRDVIRGEKTLSFSSEDVGVNYIVTDDSVITEVYRQGRVNGLRKRYFLENGVQKDIPLENKKYLAVLLFENCVVSWIDDYTGYLIIKETY